jgi:GNAT superfamily N-acetyltransferase
MAPIQVRPLPRSEIGERLGDLARLRIAVFRDWPYLYDGDAEYEAEYLRAFAGAPDAVLVAAFAGDEIVGMATASPMIAQPSAIQDPVLSAGIDPMRVFYFGESVLLPHARGRGVGHRFFDEREAGARAVGADTAMFCAVVRPVKHPLRPTDARAHDAFWTGRGYTRVPGLVCEMSWREVGDAEETAHRLQFWRGAL